MDIFGLTPIDAALSAWGLNSSHELTRILFIQTPVGAVAFAIGFLWSTFQSAKEANFKYFVIFIVITLTGLFLFILPSHQEPLIRSSSEVYGTSTVTAQSLKDSQTPHHSMPLILSFCAQMVDAISISAIKILDNPLNGKLSFLSDPFGIQRLSLQANQVIHAPIADVNLRQDLNDFIYLQYLPSLYMYTNKNPSHDLTSLWVGDERIVQHYSPQARHQWGVIRSHVVELIKSPEYPWENIKEVFKQMHIPMRNEDNQIITSMIQQKDRPDAAPWLIYAGNMQIFFPYVYGWANFCLYAAFPFLMLALIIFRQMNLFLRYIEVFVWIKSWTFCAAGSYYMSLIAARIQGQASNGITWFWEYPYYVAVAGIFLMLTPILTFMAIHQSFQLLNKRI
jgi:hypothetical protein